MVDKRRVVKDNILVQVNRLDPEKQARGQSINIVDGQEKMTGIQIESVLGSPGIMGKDLVLEVLV
jgi:hypothetical protein